MKGAQGLDDKTYLMSSKWCFRTRLQFIMDRVECSEGSHIGLTGLKGVDGRVDCEVPVVWVRAGEGMGECVHTCEGE